MASTIGRSLISDTEFDASLANPPVPDDSAIKDSYQLLSSAQTNTAQKKDNGNKSSGGNKATNTQAKGTGAPKPKRVRTGCLTCRERHLKCDEALPQCQNCQKSGRECKRGVRLNFIDTQVAAPPYSAPSPRTWQVNFRDESREIASEYLGGSARYPSLKHEEYPGPAGQSGGLGVARFPSAPHQNMLPAPSLLPSYSEVPPPEVPEPTFHTTSTAPSHRSDHDPSSVESLPIPNNLRPYLDNPEEVLLMQVFVEEVGLWMDSMDAMKHFTRILPFYALGEPMLLCAFLACGARHLYLVNPSYGEEKALYYYNTASQELLRYLQNPNRDSAVSATTAVVLNVYEIMCERAAQRMNHIAGARALIKECHWNGKSPGIGGACFWLNVGMELLSCLHFNWRLAWDPDTWGVDMNMRPATSLIGDEELWTHRMVFICAKIANFRCTLGQYQLAKHQGDDFARLCDDWNVLKNWCDEWDRCLPRSMQPLGYLQPWQSKTKSTFPEVWMIKRSAVVGRLFYHTALCLLSQLNPAEPSYSEQMLAMQQSNAHNICGLVAHVKDRGVASVSIRCLAIAAEHLTSRASQEEVLGIIDKIIKETGWQIGFLHQELMGKWGWHENASNRNQRLPGQQLKSHEPDHVTSTTTIPSASPLDMNSSLLASGTIAPAPRLRAPQGIVNPLMAAADFTAENHPYQSHYVAPQNSQPNSFQYAPY
ncbi:hypothetical protein FQN57_007525 [Myotisia sp. PD_48]|nr:hypothetical protein FQN57_007525 [Myotisia sp. PD_48]